MVKACLTSEGGAEREKGLAMGTPSLRGPLNPISPLLPGFTKCWSRQLRAAVISTQDFNEGLAAALGLW